MTETKSTKCYIEEYKNEKGQLSARLREKETGRKVDLGMTLDGKQHFLRFLSAAGARSGLMLLPQQRPTIPLRCAGSAGTPGQPSARSNPRTELTAGEA